MIQTEIKYKKQAPIIIWSFDGIEKYDMESEGCYTDLKADTTYYKIIGEFYYCGLVVNGMLFLKEAELDEIIIQVKPVITIIANDIIFTSLSSQKLDKLRKIKLKAKHISTIFEDSDDVESDEEYLFLKI